MSGLLRPVPRWLVRSREYSNFSYDFSYAGEMAAIDFVSMLTAVPRATVAAHALELSADADFRRWLSERVRLGPYSRTADSEIRYGRRLLYYMLARSLRPKLVVEAGTDKGFGACV